MFPMDPFLRLLNSDLCYLFTILRITWLPTQLYMYSQDDFIFHISSDVRIFDKEYRIRARQNPHVIRQTSFRMTPVSK